jgi:hypothetical protein
MRSYDNVWMDQGLYVYYQNSMKALLVSIMEFIIQCKRFSLWLLVAYITETNNQNVSNMWRMPMIWTLEHHGKGTLMTSIVIRVIHEVGFQLYGTNQASGKIYW